MKLTKTMATAGLITAMTAGSLLAVNAASAQTSEQQTERATQLAEKLGVEVSTVETAFGEMREEKKVEREAERAAHIAGLVEAGTLTQTQADELTALQDAAKTAMEALKDSGADREEIKTAMEANRAEVQAWADAQGINLDDIKPEHSEREGRKGHREGRKGHRGGHSEGPNEETSEES